jgi:predicted DNA-binding transcriptional regulator AlpA
MIRLEPNAPDVPAPPPDRGPLLTAQEVAEMIGDVSPSWVRRNVPHPVRLGHSTVRWHRYDVREWIESRRAT